MSLPARALDVGSGGRLTLMADVYNVLNSNAVTNFSLHTGDDGRVMQPSTRSR